MNALIWKGANTRRRNYFWVAAGIVAGVCIYGYTRMYSITLRQGQRVALVQASVPQEMKEALEGTYDPLGGLTKYLTASDAIPADKKNDLLVWPETVVLSPYTLNVDPAILKDALAGDARFAQESLARLAQTHNAYFLAGSSSFLPASHGYVSDPVVASRIPSGNWGRRYNSAYLLDPNGRYVDRYDK